ncbi:excisionase family DNA-binding protein [Sphaerisporangium sp. NPDC051017]|uniref:excisionase family DNA-binding protein n=1 Tax=Sphaerisporangium sp. NPDC051017 TaxID=3154636 RepID=UPI00341572D7
MAIVGFVAIVRAGLMQDKIRLTPRDVARPLALSQPYVSRLLDEGEIPSWKLPGSGHRVVRLPDVLEFQARRERRAEGRRRIMEIAEQADLPY